MKNESHIRTVIELLGESEPLRYDERLLILRSVFSYWMLQIGMNLRLKWVKIHVFMQAQIESLHTDVQKSAYKIPRTLHVENPLSMINISPWIQCKCSFFCTVCKCVCPRYAPSFLKWCSRAWPLSLSLCVCSVVSYTAFGESEQARERKLTECQVDLDSPTLSVCVWCSRSSTVAALAGLAHFTAPPCTLYTYGNWIPTATQRFTSKLTPPQPRTHTQIPGVHCTCMQWSCGFFFAHTCRVCYLCYSLLR